MKQNIVNIILLLIFFVFSLTLNKIIFSIFLSILAVVSLRELFFIRTGEKRIPIEIELIEYAIAVFIVMNNINNSLEYYFIDYKILVILLLSGLIPLVIINDKKKYNILDALYFIGSTIFIGITFNLLLQFRNYNNNYASYIILISLSISIFENIITNLIGKTMFLPTLNPKKSLEGVLGGIIMSTIISTMFFMMTITSKLPLHAIVIISFFLSIFGELGSLIFTFIKKEYNKLNFSKYNSKFSGILDIIDSVVFITLSFVLFVAII